MRTTANGLVLAATDLSNFLACPHRSALDFAGALEQIVAPDSLLDAHTRLLRERGEAHERAYVQHLRNEGLNVVEVPQDGTLDSRVEATIAALESGVDVVYQGAFAGQGWVGYADILRKVPSAPGSRSDFGDFHYEPHDTKLARETRGGTILQLALYADLLGQVQGLSPERFFVVAPGAPFAIHEYRVADYMAYVRLVRRRMLDALASGPEALLARSYVRQTSLRVASNHRIAIEMALEARDPTAILADTRVIVEAYNREDVESTLYLRNWLEGLRSEQVESGIDVARPVAEEEAKKEATERTTAAIALRERLLDGVPFAASDAKHPDHVRWLLAYLIDWHDREEKAEWWEFFRLRELPEEELFDEPKAIAGLQHVREMEPFLSKKGKPTGSTVHRRVSVPRSRAG